MKKQIVYLQPNSEIATQFTEHLKSDDIEVLHAKSGEEALEIIKREKVLLLLIDINIPDMRLRELAERVRRISPQIILNVCIDVIDPLLITKLSNRHNIHKIYVAPWDIDEIVEEMKESFEVAVIDEDINVREKNINSEIEELKLTLESLMDTLKRQQKSYSKLTRVTGCFLDAMENGGLKAEIDKNKLIFVKDIFSEFLKMHTTGTFDSDKFEQSILDDMKTIQARTPQFEIGNISSCLLGGQSRAYAQNIRFGIYLLARFYAQFYGSFSLSASSHYITTRQAEFCVNVKYDGKPTASEESIKEYSDFIKQLIIGMTKDFRMESSENEKFYYCSYPVVRE